MPALHPLIARLRTTDLGQADARDVRALWDAARSGGVTPAEEALLQDVFDAAGNGWSVAARDAWADEAASADRALTTPGGRASGAVDAEDLTSTMRSMWMSGFHFEADQAYAADMAMMAHAYGFKLVLEVSPFIDVATIAYELSSRTGLGARELADAVDVVHAEWDVSPWSEDNKIVTGGTASGANVKVRVSESLTTPAIAMAEAFTWTDGYHAFEYGFQGAVDERGESVLAADTAAELGQDVEEIQSYIEGGNVVAGTTPEGEAFALVGVDTVAVTAFHLRDTGALSPSEIAQRRAALEASGDLDAARTAEVAQKLARVYEHAGSHPPPAAALEEEARDFAAVLDLAEDRVASDLGLSRETTVFVTQPEFHIDMHLRPTQAGEVLVHHPRAALAALDEALAEPGLPAWEREELTQMRAHATSELAERGAMYDRIVGEIEEAGLIAIPAPGVFRSDERHANFMNAVPFAAESGEQVFATNGSSLKSLERAFERFAGAQGVDRVAFLAGSGGGQWSLSGSEESLFDAGALDCREVDTRGRLHVTNDPLDAALGV